MKRALILLISISTASLGLPGLAYSQSTGGSVSGHVRNQNREPIAGARVAAINPATNQTRSAVTDNDGGFRLPSLPVGAYELQVEADTYAKAIKQLTLRVNEDARVDFELTVAGSSEKMTIVSTGAPITETGNSVLGIVIENKQISELPLNGRNFLQLGTLVANVSSTASLRGGAEGGVLNGPFAVSGQRDRSLTFLVDGVDNNNSMSNSLAAQVSLDAIQEFKMITSLGAAEFGNHSGGMVNIVTKAGSNDFHLSAFEYFRSDALNSKNYFEQIAGQPASDFLNNQFGATLSGRIIKDRTFFMANYEGQRLTVGNVEFATVPTENQRRGLFINPLNGQQVQLPVDPVSANILDRLVPRPNAVSPFGNYLSDSNIHVRNDFGLVRVDHIFSGDDVVNARYFVSDNHTFDPIIFNVLFQADTSSNTPPTIPGFGLFDTGRAHNFGIGYTHNFTSSTINDLRFGYNNIYNNLDPESRVRPADLGFADVESTQGPFEMIIPGITKLGNVSLYPVHMRVSDYHLSESIGFLHGRHSFKAGGEVRWLNQFISTGVPDRGIMAFTGVASGISPLADFILGVPAYAAKDPRTLGAPMHEVDSGVFFQDDWQITRKLVLNLGLRYELNSVLSSPTDALINFSFSRGLYTPGKGNNPGLYDGDYNNFAPRIGFAWSVNQTGRTVVRGGYGIFYDTLLHTLALGLTANDQTMPPFLISFAPRGPGRLGQIFNPAALQRSPAVPLYAEDPGIRTPYTQHFNLNIQQELGSNLVVSIGYVGAKGTNLVNARDANQAIYLPGVDASGNPLSTAANVLFRRPTQLFHLTNFLADSIVLTETQASSIYHSLQATVTKRLSRGLSFLAAYTWSKSIDNASDPIGFTGDTGGPQNTRDLRSERARSIFDMHHRFTLGYNYELPFHGNRWVDGWRVNGITTVQSGQPYNVILNFDPSLTGSNNVRPNNVPGAFIQKDGQLMLNQSLPKDPLTGIPLALIPGPGQFGTLGRNAFTGPAYTNFDISAIKETRLTESMRLQVRFEVFNVFNTANLALPERRLTEASFGRSTKTQDVAGGLPGMGGGGPRVIQLAVKFTY